MGLYVIMGKRYRDKSKFSDPHLYLMLASLLMLSESCSFYYIIYYGPTN